MPFESLHSNNVSKLQSSKVIKIITHEVNRELYNE